MSIVGQNCRSMPPDLHHIIPFYRRELTTLPPRRPPSQALKPANMKVIDQEPVEPPERPLEQESHPVHATKVSKPLPLALKHHHAVVGSDSAADPRERTNLMSWRNIADHIQASFFRSQNGVAPYNRHRVPQACESCRSRKLKCGGELPTCSRCLKLQISCKRPVGLKCDLRKKLECLSKKVEDYEVILKDLVDAVEPDTADRIKALLGKYGARIDHSPTGIQIGDHPNNLALLSSMCSPEAADCVDEDLNRTRLSRATGFIGKSSEISWMRQLWCETNSRTQRSARSLEPGQSISQDAYGAFHAMNYHLDDMDISVDNQVDPHAIPPRVLADKFYGDYLLNVHTFFPIINRTLFSDEYQIFFDSAARPSKKWLAILNMIFAIAAKHACLTKVSWHGGETDHLIYLARARTLNLNGDALFSHPDIQQVQLEGLTAFYFLASDQINRAWRLCALALQSAITLGLNMKNSSSGISNVSKESRYRVWWCLFTLEQKLGIMTGRSTFTRDRTSTTPLPIPFDECQMQEREAAEILENPRLRDKRINRIMTSAYLRPLPLNPLGGKEASSRSCERSNFWVKSLAPSSSLFYLYFCDLSVLTQEIVNTVYSTDHVRTSWAHMENHVQLRSQLDLWYDSIPVPFEFQKITGSNSEWVHYKLALGFQFYSARIILGRPALYWSYTQRQKIEKEFSSSHELAVLALDSAKNMLALISDEPNAIRLYKVTPWWFVLHYLMQAVTVIMLELSLGSSRSPERRENLITLAKKSIRWFHAMSEFSIASKRAWQLCDMNLRRLASEMDFDVSDIPLNPHD